MDSEWDDWTEEEPEEEPELLRIPPHLFSVFEDGPFSLCSVCEEPLRTEEGDKLYEIKKIYKGRNVIFECAMCHECGHRLLREYSKESVEAIQAYFEDEFTPGLSLLECHFCSRPRDPDASGASVMAVCIGDRLIQQPVCMCDDCAESVNEKLSRKTREVNGDFIRDSFPGVPAEWQDSPIVSL